MRVVQRDVRRHSKTIDCSAEETGMSQGAVPHSISCVLVAVENTNTTRPFSAQPSAVRHRSREIAGLPDSIWPIPCDASDASSPFAPPTSPTSSSSCAVNLIRIQPEPTQLCCVGWLVGKCAALRSFDKQCVLHKCAYLASSLTMLMTMTTTHIHTRT